MYRERYKCGMSEISLIMRDQSVKLASDLGISTTEEIVNDEIRRLKSLLRYIFATKVEEEFRDYMRKECYGCQVDHPS